ncbi:hypothetical protein [Sphingomonas oleivorans]|uniref:hypothetical protein n=1 Tax=Sphingomonas oleivorans TaxID=1735121 RepID=UPI001FAFA21D|nr:hypothetical protein [Sphingomonas oleivorans]
MQRVRIGLTGLACVFLVVLLAAAFIGFTHEDAVTTVTTVSGSGAKAITREASAEGAPRDPLAELGVAPGNAPEEPAPAESPPPPAQSQAGSGTER